MKTLRLILLGGFALTLLGAGCAHNSLKLRVDIYGEDANAVVPLTPARVLVLEEALREAESEGQLLVQERTALARRLFEAYTNVFIADSLSQTKPNLQAPQQLDQPRKWLGDYTNIVQSKYAALHRAVEDAIKALEDYTESKDRSGGPTGLVSQARMQIVARHRVNRAADLLLELSEPQHTSFERSLISAWPAQMRNADPKTREAWTTKKIEGADRILPAMQALQRDVAQAEERRTRRSGALVRNLKLNQPGESDTLFKKAADQATNPGLGQGASGAVATLQTYDPADPDRNEDFSDPVWRILSSAENESKWNRAFSTNCFYAEGNSSVVIARDSPVNFRIQKGDNNPTALVQSQLQITRSIADAAIAIAGAASGMPVGGLMPKKPASENTNNVDTTAAETNGSPAGVVDSGTRLGEIEARESIRNAAVRTLRVHLHALHDQFAALDDKDLVTKTNLLRQLQSTLEGTAIVLQPSTSK